MKENNNNNIKIFVLRQISRDVKSLQTLIIILSKLISSNSNMTNYLFLVTTKCDLIANITPSAFVNIAKNNLCFSI